jgi:8-oxo-dGTP pyrophosphatase MutT (NUDIX family)
VACFADGKSANLHRHAGEVAFPGGKQEGLDFSTKETALRESNEEVNLNQEDVEIVGCLEPIVTRFGMEVHPVIGYVKDYEVIKELVPNEDEVASIFSVPLRPFLTSERLNLKNFTLNGLPYAMLEFELGAISVSGITALVLVRTAEILFDQSPCFHYFQSLSNQNKL